MWLHVSIAALILYRAQFRWCSEFIALPIPLLFNAVARGELFRTYLACSLKINNWFCFFCVCDFIYSSIFLTSDWKTWHALLWRRSPVQGIKLRTLQLSIFTALFLLQSYLRRDVLRSGVFVGSLVRPARCDFSRTRNPIFMKFVTCV